MPKKAEDRMRRNEERLDAFFKSAPAGFAILDDELRYVRVNETMAEINGLPMEDHIGRPLSDVLPDLATQIEPQLRNTLKTGEQQLDVEMSGETLSRPGELRYWVISSFPVPCAGGNEPGIGAIVVELTDRKRSEHGKEQLIAELETKNAEMEQFTYTVSHDLKSPLITVRGFLGLLRKDMASGDSRRVEDDMRRIDSATENMLQLLDELLKLSHIGGLLNAPVEVSLGQLTHEVVELIGVRIAQRGAHVEISSELPVVLGHRSHLRELLQNLICNSVKFMGAQAAPHIKVGVQQHGGERVFYVRDNGVGIEPRYHEKIFGLFDRLDPESEGTGIGLALAKRIVEVHNGRIWVESEGLGHGCTFCFTLPQESVPAED